MNFLKTSRAGLFAAILFCLPPSAESQELCVGANYHPHDSNPAQWQEDVALMHDAGFKVVRLGPLHRAASEE